MKKVLDIITLEQLRLLKESGFVVIHDQPMESMTKAGYSAGYWYSDIDLNKAFHRMVAESIRLQNLT